MKELVCRRFLRLGFLVGLLVLFASIKVGAISAAPVTLAWDASADKSVAGYAVYYRPAGSPLSASSRLDVGNALEATMFNLEANSNYLFYVVAYKTDGSESKPSNKLVYNPPAISRLAILPFADGTMDVLFRAAVGSHCRVEFSSTLDLTSWQTLGNATADSNGYVKIKDALQPRPRMRFYRAVLVEP